MLTTEKIVDVAMRLIREQGLDSLTMRAVAAELGVSAMAVYHYFPDKDDLVRMVAESIVATREPLRIEYDGWEAALRRHLIQSWENSKDYPGIGAYFVDQPTLGSTPDSLRQGVRFFEEAGFSCSTAPLAWSMAMTYIHGRISVDTHFAANPDAFRLEGLRASDYLEFGVETVLAGLRAMLALESSTPTTNPKSPKAKSSTEPTSA